MAKNLICHVEWDVTDLRRAQDFYQALFDWKFESFGDEMVVFGTGTQHIGGLSRVDTVDTGSSPSVWLEVDDLDAYVDKAQRIGGSLISARHEVPHVGWAAAIGDPDGNRIGLVQFERK